MKNYICLLFLFISATLFAQTETQTKIYLVRHAEKNTDNPKDSDPLLTAKGTERALALSEVLKGTSLNAIYTTDYKRTRATAIPTAENQKIEIQLYDAKNLKTAAAAILKNNTNKNILVIGHSNTVLEMIEAMGGKKPIKNIDDQDYNNLFLLVIAPNGDTEVKVMPYGAANATEEGVQMKH
jgi:broad specificity phosphatase PhoE